MSTGPGLFTSITASSISGAIVASTTEVGNSTVNNKVVTPTSLIYLLQNPPIIGQTTANKATFTDLTASTISGSVVGALSDISAGTTTKVVTSKILKDLFASPLALGTTTASTAKFTTLTVTNGFSLAGDTLQPSEGGTGFGAYSVGDLLVGSASGLSKLSAGSNGQVLQADSTTSTGVKWATISNPAATTSVPGVLQLIPSTDYTSLATNNTAVTPAALKTILTAPPVIGATTANKATFSDLTSSTINGGVLASDTTLAATNKVVTPANLKSVLLSPSVTIGGTTANAAKFTSLAATSISTGSLAVTGTTPWQNLQFATNAEVSAGTLTTKVVNPANIANIFANPLAIGSAKASTGSFTNLTVSGTLNVTSPPWVSVSYASNGDVTAASATNKALTPGNISTLFGSPKPIGATTPTTGTFTNLTVNGVLIGTIGGSSNKNPATVSSLTADSITGSVIAGSSDITAATSATKVLTPSLLANIFASPKPIGSTSPSTAVFTTLTANSIGGSMVATDNEITTGTATNKIVTPKGLATYITSLGNTKTTQPTFSVITALAIAGGVVASNDDTTNGSANNKVITPARLKYYAANPGVIGSDTSNAANFTTVYFETLDGPVISTSTTLTEGTSNDTIVTPYGLKTLFETPFELGGGIPSSGAFTSLNAETISGLVCATFNDATSGTVSNKVITPSILKTYMTAPHAIGSYVPNTGRFTKLTGSEINGDMVAIPDEITGGTANNKIITPYGLTTFFNLGFDIGGTNPSAGTFTTLKTNTLQVLNGTNSTSSTSGALTIVGGVGIAKDTFIGGKLSLGTKLSVPNGGTGLTSYSSGDILYGNSSNELSTLAIDSTDNKVLTIKNALPSWQSLPTSYYSFSVTGGNSSVGTNSGALTVVGGTGITGNLNVGGAVTIGTPLSNGSGGTGIGSYSPGDILYADNSGTLVKLQSGNDLQVLTLKYGLPVWRDSATTSTSSLSVTETLTVLSTTDSTNTSTGSVQIAGGMGVAKSITAGGSITIGSNLSVSGNARVSGYISRGKRTTITSNYAILESDYIIGVRTSNSITITLPLISNLTVKDRIYIIKAEITNPNFVLSASGSDTIDGMTSVTFSGAYNSLSLYCDESSEWFIY
jgi:hypothetical protein